MTFEEWFEGKYPARIYGEIADAELIQMRDEYREVWEAALAARPEASLINGEKSKPVYGPARSVAQDGKEHLYIFHNGLWYHFAPKDWKVPSNMNLGGLTK